MNIPLSPVFIEHTRSLMGEERFGRFLKAFDEEPPVSIRVNPFKHAVATEGDPVPWCPGGCYLSSRPSFTFDPLFHAGAYYVQEAGSMFIDRVLRQYVHRPVTMLDLCAAPGGKSTAARTALPKGSLLFSNEPMRQRANVLAENMQKWGHPDVVVTNNYPKDYRQSGLRFDVILADVPCSGEGMFRKDEGAVGEWSTQNVEHCRRLQREIVEDIWPCLNPGGLLIYSTCTFNSQEDEENVSWIQSQTGAEMLAVDTCPEWHITASLLKGEEQMPVYRFIPGITRTEGLFVCVLRKSDNGMAEETMTVKGRKKKAKADKGGRKQQKLPPLPAWLSGQEHYRILMNESSVMAIPEAWADIYAAASGLKILHAGITLGTVKGKNLVPSQSLALSTELLRGSFPTVQVDYKPAIAYLRTEAVTLPEGTPTGYAMRTYGGGFPIGFVKNIGNRANNLYPAEWKIKSSHVPDTAPQTGIIIDDNI